MPEYSACSVVNFLTELATAQVCQKMLTNHKFDFDWSPSTAHIWFCTSETLNILPVKHGIEFVRDSLIEIISSAKILSCPGGVYKCDNMWTFWQVQVISWVLTCAHCTVQQAYLKGVQFDFSALCGGFSPCRVWWTVDSVVPVDSVVTVDSVDSVDSVVACGQPHVTLLNRQEPTIVLLILHPAHCFQSSNRLNCPAEHFK